MHDITQAEALMAQVEPAALLGDKGYDVDHLIQSLTARQIRVVIPPKSNRKVRRDCDFALYCERNLVERFFCVIKHFRAVATRYEKTARNFLELVAKLGTQNGHSRLRAGQHTGPKPERPARRAESCRRNVGLSGEGQRCPDRCYIFTQDPTLA